MRSPTSPATSETQEAAAIEHMVDLIKSRIPPSEAIKDSNGSVIATGETVDYGATFAVAFMVRSKVNFLKEIFATYDDNSPFGLKKENKDALGKIKKHLGALRQLLNGLPGGVRYLLCSNDELDLRYFQSMAAAKFPTAIARFQNITNAMNVIHDRSGALIDDPPGEHRNVNYAHRLIAASAADLLDYHGLVPTRGYDEKPSLFEQVATSLLQATTGKTELSLMHACREALKEWESQNYLRNDFNDPEGLN